jgi:hypothetical protein
MNAETNTTLRGLETISMTELQRARVKEAVRTSEMIVTLLLTMLQGLGLGSRQANRAA